MNPVAIQLHAIGLLLEGTGHEEIVLALQIAEGEINRQHELLSQIVTHATLCIAPELLADPASVGVIGGQVREQLLKGKAVLVQRPARFAPQSV